MELSDREISTASKAFGAIVNVVLTAFIAFSIAVHATEPLPPGNCFPYVMVVIHLINISLILMMFLLTVCLVFNYRYGLTLEKARRIDLALTVSIGLINLGCSIYLVYYVRLECVPRGFAEQHTMLTACITIYTVVSIVLVFAGLIICCMVCCCISCLAVDDVDPESVSDASVSDVEGAGAPVVNESVEGVVHEAIVVIADLNSHQNL